MADTTVDFIGPVQITVAEDQVSVGPGGETVIDMSAGADGALLAANNLSDLTSAADARTNLGGTTIGKAVFIASSENAAQAAIGGTAIGRQVFSSADAPTARAALSAANVTLTEAAGVSAALGDYADDAAAAAGGVAVGKLYRTGSILKVRVA